MTITERKQLIKELIQQDKYPDALIECSNLFKDDPKDQENIKQFLFLFNRINDGNYEFEPETPEQFVMRGVAKFYNQEFEDSIYDFEKALALDSKHHYALRTRAFSLKFLGKFDEAISDLNTAIEIQPTGEYYDDLSELYQILSEYKTALKYHQLAIEISPADTRLWYNYGVDLAVCGYLEDAMVKYNKAIELWPQYEDAIVNRNIIIESLKRSFFTI